MADEILRMLARASATQLALESLRGNDVAQTLELLEVDLDLSVVGLWILAKDARPDKREHLIRALREIRAYRRVHPRRVEADLGFMANGVLVRSAILGGDRARKILEEIE